MPNLRWFDKLKVAIGTVEKRTNMRHEAVSWPGSLASVVPHMVMDIDEVASSWKTLVIGQDAAIDRMAPYIVRAIAGLNSPDRPVAAFFLMGITGSGKTKTAEALAHILQGSEKMLIRVNCGEYQGEHEVAKLSGAPPGYLGYSESQSSTVLNTMSLAAVVPNGPKLPIIIFDEIEKAHPAMGRILLGVLDKAELRLGNGQVVDFSKCIIFFTSNCGAQKMHIGFSNAPNGSVSKAANSAFTQRFPPELVNRIDEVIVYDTLSPEAIERIVELELSKAQRQIGNKFKLSYDDELVKALGKIGYSPNYGARELKRAISRHIMNPLANDYVRGEIPAGSVVVCKAETKRHYL